MKRNLLLLAVMILVAFGFSSLSVAQCPTPNDAGECDTLHLAVWDLDNELYEPGPFFCKVNLRITHDIVTEATDSLAGLAIPLCYNAQANFGPVAYCSLTAWWNSNKLVPNSASKLARSVFRHMPDMETETETNWMMELSERSDVEEIDYFWDTRILNFDGNTAMDGHFWMSLIPIAATCKMFQEGDRVLLATMTFKLDLDDSCDVYIDTCIWGTNQRLAFSNKNATTFIPAIEWKTDKADVPFHFRPFIVPNVPPTVSCPGAQSHNQNGPQTVTGVVASDVDGVINSRNAVFNGAGVSLIGSGFTNEVGLGTANYTADITYNVDNHCLAGGYFVVTVTDDGGASDICSTQITLTNTNPVITCPGNATFAYNAGYAGTATATDADGDAFTFSNGTPGTPPGLNVAANGDITWATGCGDVGGPYTITVVATDVCQGTDQCQFQLTVTNDPPVVICPPDCHDFVENEAGFHGPFSAGDPEEGDLTAGVYFVSISPDYGEYPTICGTNVCWQPTAVTLDGDYTITLGVADECGLTATCEFLAHKTSRKPGLVMIPNFVYERFNFGHWDYFPWDGEGDDNYIICDDACPPYGGINPGDWFEIPILFYPPTVPECDGIAGFELDVEFDFIDLTFYGAMRGGLLEYRSDYDPDSIFYSWEYFTYRVLPCTDLHKYKILLFGQADMPDGEFRRGYSIKVGGDTDEDPSTWWYVDEAQCDDEMVEIGPTLVWLKFRVANNELLRDLKLPIFFEWEQKWSDEPLPEDHPFNVEYFAEHGVYFGYYIIQDWDCAENSFSDETGNCLLVSEDLHEFAPFNVFDGADICSDPDQYPPYQILDFVDGGVHICSPCTSFKCVRGDINLDHIAYTTADAVLFARYFVEGVMVFIHNMDEQICATDANADGRTLMLADLVYLIRVILQVAPEIPKLGPSSEVVNVIVYDNIITTECASPIGAILFEFDGAVVPTLFADMEMVNKDNKVLVWSSDGKTITTAEVLSFIGDAELVSVTAVDYDTRDLQTSITVKVAPSAFALNPAYPNPFNPFTNLSFTLPEALNYSLKIYNVAGQLVRSYEGMGTAGLNVITWDAKDNAGLEVASGVYFYKLTAAGFSATEKMVMMK